MVALACVSRASYYRFDPEAAGPVRDVELRDAIQRIALRFPAYGRPRITAELKRQGWEVNHKRVGRILREDNLLCRRKRKFVVTTDSEHDFRVYRNPTEPAASSHNAASRLAGLPAALAIEGDCLPKCYWGRGLTS